MKSRTLLITEWLNIVGAVLNAYFAIQASTPLISAGLGLAAFFLLIAAYRAHRQRTASNDQA